jgi:hypothetical protein
MQSNLLRTNLTEPRLLNLISIVLSLSPIPFYFIFTVSICFL